MVKILLVEDDEKIVESLKYFLESNNYKVVSTSRISEAKELINDNFDLLILDVYLPDGNGFSFYELYVKNLPTIFLTAKDEEESVVKGLVLGADDYITKPFSTKELLARINKIINRNKKTNIITVKDITFDSDKMTVYKNGVEVKLSALEIKILALLFSKINKVVTRSEIIDNIWSWTGNDVNDNTVTVYLKRLREKLDSAIIITIKGIGYRIDKDE